MAFNFMTAAEAAEHFKDGDTVGFSPRPALLNLSRKQ